MHYNAMCFGWSEACYIYTLLTQEVAKELRIITLPVTGYLDDGLTGDKDFWRCLWAIAFVVKVLTCLGAVFSIPKCHFWPQQEGPWPRFVIDTVRQQFSVSPTKLEKVRAVLRELMVAEVVTPRELASAAEKIISMSPAVLPAALYSRPLFAAQQGKISWDEVFATPDEARRVARLFLERLEEWNGRRWYPRSVAIEAGSDASESGYGGTIQCPGLPVLTVGTLSEEQRRMSSTAREVLAVLRVLEEACKRQGKLLQSASVLISSDNQGAVSSINAFRSRTPEVNKLLQLMFELCSDADFDVVAQWKPRDLMQVEDDLSKHQDSSDWGLRTAEVGMIQDYFGVRPVLDLFASKAWHVTDRFISMHLNPGCESADALRLDWRLLL
jgi:hypothetical protein